MASASPTPPARFAGRIEIASATLGQPDMHIDLDGRPMSPDSVIGRAADASPATAEAASADAARLGAVTLVDGRARLTGKQLSRDLSIHAINMTLDWRKLDVTAIVTGQARIGALFSPRPDVAKHLGRGREDAK
jgi:AsmA protein